MSDEITAPSTVEDFLRVSASSNAQSLASAIAHAIYDNRQVKLRAVGAGYVAPRGLDLTCKPGFTTIESRDGEISALVFLVFAQ
jgi:stage V sporulation protein SpoVS